MLWEINLKSQTLPSSDERETWVKSVSGTFRIKFVMGRICSEMVYGRVMDCRVERHSAIALFWPRQYRHPTHSRPSIRSFAYPDVHRHSSADWLFLLRYLHTQPSAGGVPNCLLIGPVPSGRPIKRRRCGFVLPHVWWRCVSARKTNLFGFAFVSKHTHARTHIRAQTLAHTQTHQLL